LTDTIIVIDSKLWLLLKTIQCDIWSIC